MHWSPSTRRSPHATLHRKAAYAAKCIGFEILLPMTTWRQRYLQVGCGGLCGSIGMSAAQATPAVPAASS